MPCIFFGALCGAISGALIFFFKLLYSYLADLSVFLYSESKFSPIYIAILFFALVILAILMIFIHKVFPEVKGGGIPRSEGILRGSLSFRPIKTLIGTFAGSMISFFGGLPLGSEGPAVLIGTSVGNLCMGNSGKKSAWSRYVMTGGASAGFAVATGAPLSGLLFSLEEIHKRFTPMLVLTVSVSVMSATFVNELLSDIFGKSTSLFHIDALPNIELSRVGYLLLLGIAVSVGVFLFDASISIFHKFMSNKKGSIRPWMKIVLVFIFSGIIALTLTDGVFSGHDTVYTAVDMTVPVLYLLLIFIIRLLMMLLVTDSGVTGGIFIPTLAIGAVFSAMTAKLLLMIGLPAEYYTAFVLLGMCAFIGGTLRAPITATVFFVELTGQFTGIFFVAIVVFTVNLITELIGQKPFYDRVLEEISNEQNKDKTAEIGYFEMKVSEGSFVIGKAVRDIMWPPSAVVVSVSRADDSKKDMDNDGEKKLYAHDTVMIRTKFYDEKDLVSSLSALVGNDYEIKKIDL